MSFKSLSQGARDIAAVLQFVALVALLLSALPAFAQEGDALSGDVRRVVTARSPMTKSLGGGQAGELYLNSKVQVLEERGAWSRVVTQGWVRSKTLSAPSKESSKASDPAPVANAKVVEGMLRVSEFIRSTRTDVNPPREYVVLTLVNDSPRTIRNWSGLLAALDESDTAVFRERISEENIEWKPNESRQVTFYWVPSEDGYQALQAVTPEEHRLFILNIEIE